MPPTVSTPSSAVSVMTRLVGSTGKSTLNITESSVIEPVLIVRLVTLPLPVLSAQVISLSPSRSVQYGPSTPKYIVRPSPPTFTADTVLGDTAPTGVTTRSS